MRFEFHALCVLPSMGCCSNEGAFNALKSHPFFSLAANSTLKHVLLHLSYKLMMLPNIAVTR